MSAFGVEEGDLLRVSGTDAGLFRVLEKQFFCCIITTREKER